MAFGGWISRRMAGALVATIAAMGSLGAVGDAAAGVLMVSPGLPPYHPDSFMYWDSAWDEVIENNDVVVRGANVKAIPPELYQYPVPIDRAEAIVITDTGARVVADSALSQYVRCVAAEHVGVCQPIPVPYIYGYPITGFGVSLREGDDRADTRDGTSEWVDCGTGTDTVVADAVDRVSSNCESVTVG